MENVANYIKSIKQQANIDIADVYKILDSLNIKIREVFKARIDSLEICSEYKLLIDSMIGAWVYPVKWGIKSTPLVSAAINENKEYYIKLDVQHKLLIFSDINKIESEISSIVKCIQDICNDKLMKHNERVLLHKLHELYNNISADDREDLKKIVTKCFRAKYVKCENEYANREYFDSFESDVLEAETRFDSMVSTIDDSCLEKGVYLYPSKRNVE